MSDESLMIRGRKYLSSKRSAELFGYSTDYIGELCRRGRVEAVREGRQWFVEEDSLFRYLEDAREKTEERKRELSLHLSRQLGGVERKQLQRGVRFLPGFARRFAGSIFSRKLLRAGIGSFLVFALFFVQTPTARAGLEGFSLASIFSVTRSVTDELAASFQNTLAQTAGTVTAAVGNTASALAQLSGSLSGVAADLASFPAELALSAQTAFESGAHMAGGLSRSVQEVATGAFRGVAVVPVNVAAGMEGVLAGVRESAQNFTDSVAAAAGEARLGLRTNLLAAIQYEDTFNLFTSGIRDTFDALVERVTDAITGSTTVGTESPNGSESASGGGSTSVVQPSGGGVTDSRTLPERIIERIIRVETPIIQNITQTTPGTTVIGVSSADLELRLQQTANQLRQEISRLSGQSSAQISTVFQTIGQATRIDQLANTVISTPSVSGGTWSGASLTGSTNISSASISALTLSTATTTAENGFNITAGCFAVNGTCVGSGGSGDVGSGTQGYFPFYNGSGTTLTATSSIYITQGGNIGIGTTSPSVRLGVQGEVLVSGTTTTGALTATGTVTFTSGLAATSGGTGQTTFTTGDILYASGANTLAKLAAGSNGQVLKLAGGVPTWAADNTGGGGGGGSGFFSTTTNDMIIYPTDTADILVLGSNATTTTGNIFETVGNAKIGGQLLVTSSTSLQNVTAANVTSTNATTTSLFSDVASSTRLFTSNFTLGRLSGFLKATAGAVATALVDLAADVTGILPVGNGGTGVATLPAGAFLVGNGTSAVTSTSSPTVAYITATSTTATSTFAGAVNIGDQLPATAQSSSILSVLSSLTKDPLAVFGSNGSVSSAIRIQNSAGNASLFVSGGTNGFLTGTVAGDTGFRLSSNFHVGVTSALFSVSGSAGTVGIGSTTPFAKFAVNPVAGDTNQFVVGSSTATSFLINNAGQVALGTSNLYNANAALHVTATTKPHLILEDSGDNTAGFANNGSSGLVFGTQNGSFSFRTGITATGDFTSTGSERLLINSSGLVGIGSSTPFAKLAVNPVAGDTNQFVVGSSTATSFLIDNSGKVGIGTTSPAQLLSLGGVTPQIYLQNTNGRAAYFGLRDTFNAVIDAIGGGSVVLRTAGTSYLTTGDPSGNSYFNQGNVGIGTTTPISTAELTITGSDAQLAFTRGAGSATSYIGTAGAFGSAGTDDLRIRSDSSNIIFGFSGAETVKFTSGGNVGIGTTTPEQLLTLSKVGAISSESVFQQIEATGAGTASGGALLTQYKSAGILVGKAGMKFDGSAFNYVFSDFYSSTVQDRDLLTIGGNGRVGVGSSTPFAKLSVHANNGETNTSLFDIASSTASATTSLFNISNTGVITSTASATSTFAAGIQVTALNVTGATSTFANGIQLAAGCFRGSDGSCIGGGSSLTGTQGQIAYFSGTNTAVGTSEIFLSTGNLFGIGSTTPFAKLAVNPVAGDTNQFVVGSSTRTSLLINNAGMVGIASTSPFARFAINPLAGDTNQFLVGSSTVTSFIIDPAGKVGIGKTAPATRLDVFEANSVAQLRLSKSASLYSELTVDSTGDLTVSAAGGDIYAVTENLWICDGGSCPALTATSTAGNIFVENAVTFGNGFSFRQISVNELGLYNASSSLLMIFDQGN